MAFTVTELPYPKDALDPAISAETLSYHHGKHHQAYIDKTNKAVEGTDMADKSLIEVISKARGSDQGLFNNAAQSWNQRVLLELAESHRVASVRRTQEHDRQCVWLRRRFEIKS